MKKIEEKKRRAEEKKRRKEEEKERAEFKEKMRQEKAMQKHKYACVRRDDVHMFVCVCAQCVSLVCLCVCMRTCFKK